MALIQTAVVIQTPKKQEYYNYLAYVWTFFLFA